MTYDPSSPSLLKKVSHWLSLLRNRSWFPVALIVLVTLVIHHSAFVNEFYWDDRSQVLEAKLTDSWEEVSTIFTSEVWRNVENNEQRRLVALDTYRPLFNLSLLVDNQLFGHSRAWHHGVNLAIHLVNIVLVFLLTGALFDRRGALLTAALFALHPATVTCIHYVSARPDSMSAMFAMLAAWIALRPSARIRNHLVAAVFFILAFLSKESVLLVPVWVVVALWITKPGRRLAVPSALFIASIAIYFALRLNALGSVKAVEDNAHILDIIINFPMVMLTLVRVSLFALSPLPLRQFGVQDYPFSVFQWSVAVLFYIVVSVLVVWGLLKKHRWGLPLLWVLFLMAPSTVAVVGTDVINGYYYYAAVVGIAMGITLLLCAVKTAVKQQWVIPAFWATLLFTAGSLSFLAAQHFRTEISFYKGIIDSGDSSATAAYNLGNAYLRISDTKRAIAVFETMDQSMMKSYSVHNNLAVAYLRAHNYEKALKHSTIAARLKPDDAKYRYNLGLCYLKLKEWKRGMAQLEKSLELDPSYISSRDLVEQFCRTAQAQSTADVCNRLLKKTSAASHP